MTEYYRRHFLGVDFSVAFTATVSCFLYVMRYWGAYSFAAVLHGDRQVLYSAMGQLSGALLGFILAAASIIVVVVPSPRFRVLRESGRYPDVFRVYFRAIFWLGWTSVVSFGALLTDTDASPKVLVTFLVMFLALMSVSRLGHSIAILRRITLIAAQQGT